MEDRERQRAQLVGATRSLPVWGVDTLVAAVSRVSGGSVCVCFTSVCHCFACRQTISPPHCVNERGVERSIGRSGACSVKLNKEHAGITQASRSILCSLYIRLPYFLSLLKPHSLYTPH